MKILNFHSRDNFLKLEILPLAEKLLLSLNESPETYSRKDLFVLISALQRFKPLIEDLDKDDGESGHLRSYVYNLHKLAAVSDSKASEAQAAQEGTERDDPRFTKRHRA